MSEKWLYGILDSVPHIIVAVKQLFDKDHQDCQKAISVSLLKSLVICRDAWEKNTINKSTERHYACIKTSMKEFQKGDFRVLTYVMPTGQLAGEGGPEQLRKAYELLPETHPNWLLVRVKNRGVLVFAIKDDMSWIPKTRSSLPAPEICSQHNQIYLDYLDHIIHANCGYCRAKPQVMKKCGGCKAIHYCSKECQVAHWSEHKVLCKLFGKMHSDAASSV